MPSQEREPAPDRVPPARIRQWAAARGIDIVERASIPRAVVALWRADLDSLMGGVPFAAQGHARSGPARPDGKSWLPAAGGRAAPHVGARPLLSRAAATRVELNEPPPASAARQWRLTRDSLGSQALLEGPLTCRPWLPPRHAYAVNCEETPSGLPAARSRPSTECGPPRRPDLCCPNARNSSQNGQTILRRSRGGRSNRLPWPRPRRATLGSQPGPTSLSACESAGRNSRQPKSQGDSGGHWRRRRARNDAISL